MILKPVRSAVWKCGLLAISLLLMSMISSACGKSWQAGIPTEKPIPTQTALLVTPPAAPAGQEQARAVFNIMPESSAVTYSVGETLIKDGNRFNLAAGITTAITGTLLVDTQNPQNSSLGTFTVNLSQFKSNNDQRDQAIRDKYLESSRFPLATFQPTAIEGLPAEAKENQIIVFKVTGDLTVRQVTKSVTFDVKITVSPDLIKGTAAATLLLSDFGIGPISVPGVIKTEDNVGIIFTFEARPTT